MTLHSKRSTWIGSALAIVTAVLLSSCGGGGASQQTTGGTLSMQPATGTVYAGVPFSLTILGGQPLYSLSSTEPSVLPVPSTTKSSSITLLAANPGVVDTGLAPGALQVRTVTITARDATGQTATATLQVGQNFLTGYGVAFAASAGTVSCTSPSSSTSTSIACSGSDTVIRFQAVTNGNLYGGRTFRLHAVQGNFTLVNPDTGASGPTIDVTSDHTGTVTAIVRVNPNVSTQVGILSISDVVFGVSANEVFTIQGGLSTTQLTAIPNSFTFTGPDTATCGTGTGTFLVFDGQPPYTAISSDPNVVVTFIDPNHNPGQFQLTANNRGVCLTNAAVVVTDSAGARTSVTVTTSAGSAAPTVPPTPITVVPSAITLGCGQSATVSAVGGNSSGGTGGTSSAPTYSASSSNPNIGAVANGSTITITQKGTAGPGSVAQTTSNVIVTDGSTTATVAVTFPTTCP